MSPSSIALRTVVTEAAVPLGLAAAIVVLVTAFAWPTSHLEPRGVPVAVAGSADFVATTSEALEADGASAFDIQVATDAATGEQMLRDNEIDGLFLESTASGKAPSAQLELASAGRAAVAQLLTQVETRLVGEERSSPVRDAVAAPRDDPRSAVFTAAALPTVLGAIASGVVIALLGGSRTRRLVRLAVVSGVAGGLLTLVLDDWFGALLGSWWALAGCYALGLAAVTSAIVGLHNLLGRVGMSIAAATVMLLGNPLSGATSAPELLADGWSGLGRVLPPGALVNAVRAVAFYHGDGAGASLVILSAWVGVGLLLLWSGPAASLHRRELASVITGTRAPTLGEDRHPHPAHLG